MIQVPLTQGRFALVDDADFALVSQFKWYVCICKNTCYAMRKEIIDGKYKRIGLHSFLMGAIDKLCDFIDGNGLNCQRSNLRIATRSQDAMNKKAWGSSKYLGVSYNVKNGTWRSYIRIKGKLKSLGSYVFENDAALAYNEAAIERDKDFARLNIIVPVK